MKTLQEQSKAEERKQGTKKEKAQEQKPEDKGKATSTKAAEEDPKDKEMVDAGFERNTHKVDIKTCLEDLLLQADEDHAEIITTRPMTSFGIIRFQDSISKTKFKKWLGRTGSLSFEGRSLQTRQSLLNN